LTTSLFAFFIFFAILAVCFGVYGFSTRSKLSEFFASKVAEQRFLDVEPFFNSLWSFARSGVSINDTLKLAAIATAVAVAIGMCVQGAITAAVFGILAFFLAPRVFIKIRQVGFEKKFTAQFPQAVASFSAAARVFPLRLCFGSVAKESKPPVQTVFTYIQDAVEKLGTPPHKAITEAAEEFGLPILLDFADTVRTLDELGGGEHAGDLLDAAAEECRFKQRHQMEVTSMFGELRFTMMAATGVPVVVFLLFLSDRNGDYYQMVMKMPWLILLGAIVLIAGWVISESLVSSAKQMV
jgi:Flp pilus assembly protein TadB